MCLAGRHIRGEIRVTFRLDIVHINRSIGIRSKIHKPVSEVLQPIMSRYLPDTPLEQIFCATCRDQNAGEYVGSSVYFEALLAGFNGL